MKVYGKPPLPPPSSGKGKVRKLFRAIRSTVTETEARSPITSLADIIEPGLRNQSAPALLTSGVKVNAKVIHLPKPKPLSASSIRTRNTSMSSVGSGSAAGSRDICSGTSSQSSTPTHRPKGRIPTSAGTTRSQDSPNQLSHVTFDFCEEGEILSLDPPPRSPSKLTHDDDYLLSQSDELCREVLSLCQGNPEKSSPDFFFCPNYDQGHRGGGDELFNFDLSGEPLTSLPSLSLISSLETTPMPTGRTSPGPPAAIANEISTENPEKLLSPIRHPPESPEYDYQKVFGILRMIEEEEAKGSDIASCFGEFLREKVIGGSTSVAGQDLVVDTGRPGTADTVSSEHQIKGGHDIEDLGHPFSTVSSPLPERGSDYCESLASPPPTGFCPEFYLAETKDHGRGQGSTDWQATDKNPLGNSSRSSLISEPWETTDGKTKNLFSFLDQVEQSDRDFLFNLKFDSVSSPRAPSTHHRGQCHTSTRHDGPRGHSSSKHSPELTTASKLDTLIRKGSAELARDLMMLERQVEDSAQNIHVLEETLLSQRELNIRNMKNSEKEMKKRLKLQQEEYELTLSRHQAFLDQIINEKRALQEKCEKVLKESKVTEEKFQSQIKSLQEKHLEEIKRLRKVQESAEKNKKHQWVGKKTQEIRDMTVKGLEPEVQRLIQRHQQEMAETRAYYADEIQEIEDRFARKQTQQLQELRENFHREKEESVRRERELLQKRFESEMQRQAEDFETQKRRVVREAQEEKERLAQEEIKIRESAQENVRKGQIKCEVEVENVRQEYDLKMSAVEKRHEKEIQSLRDNFESQRENWILTFNKKNEQILQDRETRLIESLSLEKEKEGCQREKKVKEEYERIRKEEETVQESRIKRLQEKFQSELEELERSERELKVKFSSLKAELLGKEEELFSIRTTLGLKTKENQELSESNFKMAEERIHLTSIIRREFTSQIETLEEDCKAVKAAVVELKSKHKHDLESHQLDLEKLRVEKDTEMEKLGLRVKQMLGRKEEMLQELGKQLEKSSIRVNHLENLLEEQRKNFVQSVTSSTKKK